MRERSRLTSAVLLLAGIAGIAAILTMQLAVHRSVVKIPDLRGLPLRAATRRAASLGLDLSVAHRLYSTASPAGSVLLQSPAMGTPVRRGWEVEVAESLGPRRVSVPDVVGRSEREAMLTLQRKGLVLGSVAHLPSTRAPTGTVLAQDPGPNAQGAEQPGVSLLVAAPGEQEKPAWVMPDEVGKPYAVVAAQLTQAGLLVESATGAPPGAQVTFTPNTTPDTVLAQQPVAGERVDATTRITLSVAGPRR